jgi:multicomponent Na+:H+ antiporter subunit D
VVAISLLLTVAAGPIYGLAERAAASLTDRSIYVDAVLDSGVPPPPGADGGSTGEGG